MKPYDDPEDMEELAAAEHRQWGHWTAYMLREIKKALHARDFLFNLEEGDTFDEFLDAIPCIERWTRQIGTHYDELSESEKESDRKEVRLKLPIYRKEENG